MAHRKIGTVIEGVSELCKLIDAKTLFDVNKPLIQLHQLNRSLLSQTLCTKLKPKHQNNNNNKRIAVLLQGGSEINHDDSDTTYVFRQESFFHHQFGVLEPDHCGAIIVDIFSGNFFSFLFLPKLSIEYETWLGKIPKLEDHKKRYGVDDCFYLDSIADVLNKNKVDQVLMLKGINSDSGECVPRWKVPNSIIDETKKTITFHTNTISNPNNSNCFSLCLDVLYEELCELRVIKTELELEVLRAANKISSLAHREVMQNCSPGMSEYMLESMFQHFCYFHGSCRNVAYTCIACAGESGSVLHYGHAGAPNSKVIKDGDMMLLDMGCELKCYASDITNCFPINGKFTAKQRVVYESVLNALKAVEAALKPNVRWNDMHLLAERVMLKHLRDHGNGLLHADADVDEMVEARLGAVFMPHGLGHFLGLNVHDVGGYQGDYLKRSDLPGLCKLRTTRTMKPGMVITVEPGCYFIDYLLDEALKNPKLSKYINEKVLNSEYRGMGGVRLEDDVVITHSGIEILTDVPRTVEDIEAWMKTKKTSLL